MNQIEPLEPEWRPPEAKVVFEQMQAEIAKAFVLPDWAMRSPEAHSRAMRSAYEATEIIRAEAVRLYIEHCFPRARLTKR